MSWACRVNPHEPLAKRGRAVESGDRTTRRTTTTRPGAQAGKLFMENRAFRVLAALLLCCVYAAPAESEPLRVLYAEPFQAQTTRAPGAQKASPPNLRVQAFGRTFELQLEDNMRLLRATSAQTRERLGAIQLLKGTIKEAPGSWVRLTLSGGRYSGAFWDGTDLYAITPRETLDTALLTPMQPA